ncbi:MAG: hypothetical protein K9J13_10925 [Saprospiraceae bacterium]|nr:hypothetical protein [Saprospiraceae bacterium]
MNKIKILIIFFITFIIIFNIGCQIFSKKSNSINSFECKLIELNENENIDSIFIVKPEIISYYDTLINSNKYDNQVLYYFNNLEVPASKKAFYLKRNNNSSISIKDLINGNNMTRFDSTEYNNFNNLIINVEQGFFAQYCDVENTGGEICFFIVKNKNKISFKYYSYTLSYMHLLKTDKLKIKNALKLMYFLNGI